MIKLNYEILDEFVEYDLIVNSKHEPSKTTLLKVKQNIRPLYNKYIKNFDSIHKIGNNKLTIAQSEELKKLYSNSTTALNNLKAKLINSQRGKLKFLCPYCLIHQHTTFDHYIPKEEYPAYSVMPKNLIPCCDTCNKKKLEYWRESGHRTIIHFYIDEINSGKFLFCDLNFYKNIPTLEYKLSFDSSINKDSKLMIEKHFNRLDLLKRYNEQVPDVISDIHTDYSSLSAPLPIDVKTFLRKKAKDLFLKCGRNYWYGLAYEKLAHSAVFLNSLNNQ